jgi:hypothetical protein
MESAMTVSLPMEIWACILSFLKNEEEYVVALVCRDFCALMRRRREKRKETIWRTPVSAFVNSVARIRFAFEHDCPRTYKVSLSAARGGVLEVLQEALAQGCGRNSKVCAAAALGGHLPVLQLLRHDGCPWDENTCIAAAWGGHFGVLQWARENGCPWDIQM